MLEPEALQSSLGGTCFLFCLCLPSTFVLGYYHPSAGKQELVPVRGTIGSGPRFIGYGRGRAASRVYAKRPRLASRTWGTQFR